MFLTSRADRIQGVISAMAALLLLTGLLSACGFTLRSDDAGQLHIGTLQLQSNLGPELTRAISEQLRQSGVQLATPESDRNNLLVLRLQDEELSQRPLSVNTRARGAEYEIELDITAELYRDGTLLAGPEILGARREHDLDPANISASDREMQNVMEELHNQIAQLLIRRLASIDVTALQQERSGPQP